MTVEVSNNSLREDLRKAQSKAYSLEHMVAGLFDWLDGFVIVLRAILYLGSFGMAWFYLQDKVLAIGVVVSLTVAHLLIAAREKIQEKQAELRKL